MKDATTKSQGLGRLLVAVFIADGLFMICYFGLFFIGVLQEAPSLINWFAWLKEWLFTILLLVVVLDLFLMGLWIYAFHIDMYYRFRKFDARPQSAMLSFLLPIINFVGIGLEFSRIINFIDANTEDPKILNANAWTRIGVMVFYGGLVGVVFTSILSWQIVDSSDSDFYKMLGFYAMQSILFIATFAGLVSMLIGCNRVIQYKDLELRGAP